MIEPSPPENRQELFMTLFTPLQSRLERFIVQLVGNREDATDVLQDTILAAWQHFDNLRDHSSFGAYIYTIASNMVKRRHRKARLFSRWNDAYDEVLESPTPSPERSADITIIKSALAELPHAAREAILLHDLQGLSIEEVRKIQGGTLSAVKVRLMRARRQLAKKLGVEATPSPSLSPALEQ